MNKNVRFQVQGGIGNQLFGYFAAKYYEAKTNKKVVIDKSQLNKGFTIHNSSLDDFELELETHKERFSVINFAFFRSLLNRLNFMRRIMRIYIPREVGFDTELLNQNGYKIYRGYFQTYKYIDWLAESEIKIELKLKNQSSWYLNKSHDATIHNPIIMHFRLGDYKFLELKYGILSVDYYLNALHIVRKKLPNNPIWIFSDEPGLVKPFLEMPEFKNAELIILPPNIRDSESLMLMSKGAAIIIANSSFSWWAAKFSSKECLKIAPSKWYLGMKDPLDLIPDQWLRVESAWRTI